MLHDLQKSILFCLKDKSKTRYSVSKELKVSTSGLKYHFDQLIEQGLVKKNCEGFILNEDKVQVKEDMLLVNFANEFQMYAKKDSKAENFFKNFFR